MSDPNSNKPKITLEDLLRLKRHERPGPEYWARFDHELNDRVWRSLTQPAESRWSWILALSRRQLSWMTAGAVSALTLALAWPGHYVVATAPKMHVSEPVKVATSSVPTPKVSAEMMQNFAAAPATDDLPAAVPPKFVVAAVTESVSPAGSHKVPAVLNFSVGHPEGELYASDTLSNPAFPVRLRGSAY